MSIPFYVLTDSVAKPNFQPGKGYNVPKCNLEGEIVKFQPRVER